jgi:hypothetical protein
MTTGTVGSGDDTSAVVVVARATPATAISAIRASGSVMDLVIVQSPFEVERRTLRRLGEMKIAGPNPLRHLPDG